jgi:hypothetical protein
MQLAKIPEFPAVANYHQLYPENVRIFGKLSYKAEELNYFLNDILIIHKIFHDYSPPRRPLFHIKLTYKCLVNN